MKYVRKACILRWKLKHNKVRRDIAEVPSGGVVESVELGRALKEGLSLGEKGGSLPRETERRLGPESRMHKV